MSKQLAFLAPPRAVGLMPTVERVLEDVRLLETGLLAELPSKWVAGYGPRILNLKAAMLVLRACWTDFEAEVRRRNDLIRMEQRLVTVAAWSAKIATDLQLVIREARVPIPFNPDDDDPESRLTLASIQAGLAPGRTRAADEDDDD